MAKNEEGEFELILGNRQLMGVFLIGVILLAAFFSMGYIVGRNSAPGPETAAKPAETRVADSTAKSAEPAAAERSSPAPEPATTQHAPDASAPRSTAAPTETAQAATPAPPPPPPAAAPKQEKPSASGPLAAASSVTASVTSEPAPGEYWQVVATSRPDAEIITETLTKKGFHAVLAPAPKEGVFRVLVGPQRDASAQSQARTSLEAAGFKNPIARKY